MKHKTPYIPGTKILDQYHRDLEPEIGSLGFATAKLKSIDEALRTAEFVISSGEIDRYGEIVDPAAFDAQTIEAFMANPVALAAHQHSGLNGECTVVGTWLAIRRDGNQTIGVCQFDTDELGEQYWGKVRRGKLKACSIGFIVRAWEMREVGTGEAKRSVRVFTKIELIEISIVAVPANRQALMKAAGFGSSEHSQSQHSADHAELSKLIEDQITKVLTDPLGPVDGLIREVVAAVHAGESCGHDHHAGFEQPRGDDDTLKQALRELAGD